MGECRIETEIMLAVLVGLLLASVLFSACETAYSSLSRVRLRNIARKGGKGDRRVQLALKLHEDFDNLLSTCLVGSNVVNLVAASICTLIFMRHFGEAGATLSTVVLTVVVVVFGEVSPKVLAKQAPENVAALFAPCMRVAIIIFAPINRFFVWWRTLLNRVFALGLSPVVTEEELFSLVEEANEAGTIHQDGRQLLHNALSFYGQKARDILTPRIDVAARPKDAGSGYIAKIFQKTGFSRLPVYEGSLDHIIGVMHLGDFMTYVLGDAQEGDGLQGLISPAVFVPEHMYIRELFGLLKQAKNHMAIVTDEYGGTEGIVTMEDILEELVGEIWDETDKVVEKFVKLEPGKYRVSCAAHMDDVIEYFALPKNSVTSPALSGWVMQMLGKIPQVGDSFSYEDIKVTIEKVERRRALECIIERIER